MGLWFYHFVSVPYISLFPMHSALSQWFWKSLTVFIGSSSTSLMKPEQTAVWDISSKAMEVLEWAFHLSQHQHSFFRSVSLIWKRNLCDNLVLPGAAVFLPAHRQVVASRSRSSEKLRSWADDLPVAETLWSLNIWFPKKVNWGTQIHHEPSRSAARSSGTWRNIFKWCWKRLWPLQIAISSWGAALTDNLLVALQPYWLR